MQQLITQVEVAKILGVKERTLEDWRYNGTGPTYIRVGTKVRYRPADIEAYISEQAVAR